MSESRKSNGEPGARPAPPPVVFGCAGMGGYARAIADLLLAHGRGGPRGGAAPAVRLAAVCEPDLTAHAARADELRAAGVKVLGSYDDLLAEPIEAVWLPLPIDLHRPFTERALAAGKAVMCEKPAAGSVDDVDAMIAARDVARLPVAIGYQDIYDPRALDLKRRLAGGAIGRVETAVVVGLWPRDARYFARAPWAGRFGRGGAWVMDSPVNNAMAHFLNLALFLLGPTERESAIPAAVEAELYRANPIENFDTCALRLTAEGGARVLVLMTHACAEAVDPVVELRGTAGRARYAGYGEVEVEGRAGRLTLAKSREPRDAMVDRFARWLRGSLGEDMVATLEVARAPLVAVNGASEAAAIRDVPAESVKVLDRDGAALRAIEGIGPAFAACAAREQLPHEWGQLPWATPAGRRDLRGYRHFAGPRQDKQVIG